MWFKLMELLFVPGDDNLKLRRNRKWEFPMENVRWRPAQNHWYDSLRMEQ